MARRRKKRVLRPRMPARLKRKKRARKGGQAQHQHHELAGLGLVALGIFLAGLFYLGWSGGSVGTAIADGFREVVGAAAYSLPVILVAVGGLMVARSSLVDVQPFRTGLVLVSAGLLLALGRDHGGYVGQGLEAIFGRLLGSTGAMILGGTALLIGLLLLSGASAGAIVRRSGHAARSVGSAARRRFERDDTMELQPPVAAPPAASQASLVDGTQRFPDVVGEPERSEPALLVQPEPETLFAVGPTDQDYRLPGPLDSCALRRRAPATTARPASAWPSCSSARSRTSVSRRM